MSDQNQTLTAAPPADRTGPVVHVGASRGQAWLGVLVGAAVLAALMSTLVLAGPSVDMPGAVPPPSAAVGSPQAPAPQAPAQQAPAPQPPGQQDGARGAKPKLPPGTDPALGTRPAVTKGSAPLTGLVVTPLIKGSGPAVAPGQTVTINYVGASYSTGKVFDATWDATGPMPLMLGQSFPGLDQGLTGVTVGSRVQLDIPSDLAFGDQPADPNAPAGPLRFVVDVLAAE